MPGADIQLVAWVYFGISALTIIFITYLFIFVLLRDPIVIDKLKEKRGGEDLDDSVEMESETPWEVIWATLRAIWPEATTLFVVYA